MDYQTHHLISTLRTQLLGIIVMIETDNLCTTELVKESLIEIIIQELDGYYL